ncbi:MFS transporter [Lentzea sp. CA-135723]|uniref:MFS transporter n=1 Tax=Lentzea sp. CA-135723 TaxID=3239950 RepID=UPI003D8A8BE2
MPTEESDEVSLGSRFHRLFGATLVSSVGTGMHAAALPLLALQTGGSPMALSAVVMAAEIPWVLLSLHAGVAVDRLDRRRVMVRADLARFAVLVVLAALVLTGRVTLLWLVAAAFLLGVGQVFFDIAAQSAIPDFVSRDPRKLAKANGRIVAAESNGEDFVGPPLGSALFGVWNFLPFAGNALSFAASGLLLGQRLRHRAVRGARAAGQGGPPPAGLRLRPAADGHRHRRDGRGTDRRGRHQTSRPRHGDAGGDGRGPVGAALGGVLASVFTIQVTYVVAGAFLVLVAVAFYPLLNNRALARATDESAG